MTAINGKAVRVEEATIVLATCPVCHKTIDGTAEVAVHLGGLTIGGVAADGYSVDAQITATTRLRALRVRHDCTAPTTRAAGTDTVDLGAVQ